MAGIQRFSTGGIGGVHREGEFSWNVSADLTELAQTNLAVVCAGRKSILDFWRTLEYLETLGVPVAGYQTTKFRRSIPENVNSVLPFAWNPRKKYHPHCTQNRNLA